LFVTQIQPLGISVKMNYERTGGGTEVACVLCILVVLFISEVFVTQSSMVLGQQSVKEVAGEPDDPNISVTGTHRLCVEKNRNKTEETCVRQDKLETALWQTSWRKRPVHSV